MTGSVSSRPNGTAGTPPVVGATRPVERADPAVGKATVGVAIDIPEPWESELTQRRAAAGDPAAAFVPAHLTLLGPTEVDTARYGDIQRHLRSGAAPPPPLD